VLLHLRFQDLGHLLVFSLHDSNGVRQKLVHIPTTWHILILQVIRQFFLKRIELLLRFELP